MPSPDPSVNPGYAVGQLAKALQTQATHPDPATRERAAHKADTWAKLFADLLAGVLRVGSRTPLAGTPPWVTLEVAHGGFATGNLAAGGPLRPHERELVARLPAVAPGRERAALNAFFVSDPGLAELQSMLEVGCYRVTVPEEGALLTVAWLLGRGEADAAHTLLDAVGPWFDRLRFFPVPAPTPLPTTAAVRLQGVGDTVAQLRRVRDRPRALAQWEAVHVWVPVWDRVVALFAETVADGWPCQQYPPGWDDRAAAVLADYRRLRTVHGRCSAPDHPRRPFARLRGYLATAARDPRALTGREVGLIRSVLLGVEACRGLPTGERATAFRRDQAARVPVPAAAALAGVLADRLATLPPDEGLDDPTAWAGPVTPVEAARTGLAAGRPLPDPLPRKLRRSWAAPVATLVGYGVIPSAEVLARVVPQITARVRSAGLPDPAARRLDEAVYAAFRRRRSLLLLNLESQVKLGELPWVRPLEAHRTGSARDAARLALAEVVTEAVTNFPWQPLPNKLLQEVRALADAAGLAVPVTDELAADIFMGEFTAKFLAAAQVTARVLGGTLYERYYALPFARVLGLADVRPSRHGPAHSPGFTALCFELAGRTGPGRPAENGTVIEQQQLLTTHNLVPLLDALGLAAGLDRRRLAEHCFAWACRRLQRLNGPGPARLRAVKNAAFAWRQMVVFLALLPAGEVDGFLGWADARLGEQPAGFGDRFRPVLAGLRQAAAGTSPARPLLGWSAGRHPLLGT